MSAFIDIVLWPISVLQGIVGDWGMAIVLATLLFRLIILPLDMMQTSTSKKMTELQPQVDAIKEKYRNNQQAQDKAIMDLYSKAKYNPYLGCLPLLLQIPVFFALFQGLRELPQRFGDQVYCFFTIVNDLSASPADAWNSGLPIASYIVLVLLFALLTVVPLLVKKDSMGPFPENMRYPYVAGMFVMMLLVAWNCPAGVLLFWIVCSAVAVVQSFVTLQD